MKSCWIRVGREARKDSSLRDLRESMALLVFDLLTCERNNSHFKACSWSYFVTETPGNKYSVFSSETIPSRAKKFLLGILCWLFYICPHYSLHFHGLFHFLRLWNLCMVSPNSLALWPPLVLFDGILGKRSERRRERWWDIYSSSLLLWWRFGYSCHLYNVAFCQLALHF